jgi:hypothetical protein
MRHARDGISFACGVTLGAARDAAASMGAVECNDPEYYELLSGILGNQSFHSVLEEFATTGFVVLREDTRRAMQADNRVKEVAEILDIEEPIDHIVNFYNNKESGITFSLDPTISDKLRYYMRMQNKDHDLHASQGSATIRRHLAQVSFTSGCPVRKAPKSEIEKGNEKSAIALLSDYIGELMINHLAEPLKKMRLAHDDPVGILV